MVWRDEPDGRQYDKPGGREIVSERERIIRIIPPLEGPRVLDLLSQSHNLLEAIVLASRSCFSTLEHKYPEIYHFYFATP